MTSFYIDFPALTRDPALILDLEASGNDPRIHSALETGVMLPSDPTQRFYVQHQAWEGAQFTEDAFACNGINPQSVEYRARQSFNDGMREIAKKLKDFPVLVMTGQNITYDWRFLEDGMRRAGIQHFPFGRRTFDLHGIVAAHALARGKQPPMKGLHSDLTSDAMSQYVGIRPERHPHTGETGPEQEVEIYNRVVFGKRTFTDLFPTQLPPYLQRP